MLYDENSGRKARLDAPVQTPVLKPSQTDSHDAQLVRRIAEKDHLAFEALYRSFFHRLARFLDRLTRNTILIEEIVNDTMFVVWRKAETFDRTSKVSTWIFSIAYRTALKAFRNLDEPVEMDFGSVAADAAYDPENETSQRQTQKLISKALDALPIDQRTVVSLAYYHGMGYQEIAAIVDCPVNTVKTRMFHARRRLKVLLQNVME
jgi:RNA polymerase sigma-70 factor (ECF subfamily)